MPRNFSKKEADRRPPSKLSSEALSRLGEFGLIDRFGSILKFKSPQVIQGIGDDCAVFASGRGCVQVITTDAMVENVHFDLAATSPLELGWKVLAVNVSDIASMGAEPRCAVISLAIPPRRCSLKFLDDLYRGLNKAGIHYGVQIAGGDTVRSTHHLFLSLTLVGEARRNRLFTRSGARPGDAICVTGTLGDSALGLKLLQNKRLGRLGRARDRRFLIDRHKVPQARLQEALQLARSRLRVSAMIDISDGLVQDLGHVLDAGRVGAIIQEALLPTSQPFDNICTAKKFRPLDFILKGGEDYELLFTINPNDVKKLGTMFQKLGLPVTHIGEVTAARRLTFIRTDGRRETLQKSLGYNHFKA